MREEKKTKIGSKIAMLFQVEIPKVIDTYPEKHHLRQVNIAMAHVFYPVPLF